MSGPVLYSLYQGQFNGKLDSSKWYFVIRRNNRYLSNKYNLIFTTSSDYFGLIAVVYKFVTIDRVPMQRIDGV